MAKDKRATVETDMFVTPEPKHETKPQEKDEITAQGVGLRLSEWAELDTIAADLGMTPHALRVYAVRYFLAQYKAGKIKTAAKTTKTLPGM